MPEKGYIRVPKAHKKIKRSAGSRYEGQDVSRLESLSAMNGVIRVLQRRYGDRILHNMLWTEPSRFNQALRERKTKTAYRTNHIVGLKELLYKTGLANVLNAHYSGKNADFYPPTAVIKSVEALDSWCAHNQSNSSRFILKPGVGHQGDYITVAETAQDVSVQGRALLSKSHAIVVQEYLSSPMLLEGKKFDFRIYVLIESSVPLRVHVFREGLARFCTQDYDVKQLSNSMMHLTNYTLNSKSDNFVDVPSAITPYELHTKQESLEELHAQSYTTASKRGITITLEQLQFDAGKFWSGVDEVICKTFAALKAPLLASQRQHTDPRVSSDFQVVGIDVMLTSDGHVRLIEANNNPSMLCKKCSLDSVIKQGVMNSVLDILALLDNNSDKTSQEESCWYAPYKTFVI